MVTRIGANGERPSEMEPEALAAWVYARLVEAYGVPAWEPDGDALGGLIATILSQHTSDLNSERAYASLRERFPTWEAARDAPQDALSEAIRSGGLARVKARSIQRTLRALTARDPEAPFAMRWLDTSDIGRARTELTKLPGVGMKTASCALLFSLGAPAFPVDTHVLRVTKRLGLIGASISADAAHSALERLIPPEWRHTMHINLIRHGRQVCHARRHSCESCLLRARCAYYWAARAADGA
jgi:endonuclease-3